MNREQHKSISTNNPAITENMKCTIVKVHTPVIDIKVGVSFNMVYRYASFHFQLFERLATITSKE